MSCRTNPAHLGRALRLAKLTPAAWLLALGTLAGLTSACPASKHPTEPGQAAGADAGGGAARSTGPVAGQKNATPGDKQGQDSVEGKADPSDPLALRPDTLPQTPQGAPEASPRVGGAQELEALKGLLATIDQSFEGQAHRRLYVQTDKPLYKPGETIWVKSVDLSVRGLEGSAAPQGYLYQLLSPRGSAVKRKRVKGEHGLANNDFVLPEGVAGGEYTLRVVSDAGLKGEAKLIVSNYEPPRIKKKLEFMRKAYGAGDEVSATLSLKRATGEVLANHKVKGLVTLDGAALPALRVTTDAKGNARLRFTLPATIVTGDGLLSALVEEGGITESVSKRVPIVLKKVQLSFFPEGGKLVEGLPGRLYFEAKNLLGKPADLEGKIVDDLGNAVARFSTYKNGLGRLDFTAATGRSYHAEVTRPVGVLEHYALPLAEREGCIVRSYDDLDGQLDALRVGVACSSAQAVTVVATLRDQVIDGAQLAVPATGLAVAYLKADDKTLNSRQGVARVTVFDAARVPLAERLIYRKRRARLQIELTPEKLKMLPREQVLLRVTTRTAAGEPVPAELALSVVDDTVLSYADDKSGHLLEKLYLEPELPGKIEEPRFYFNLKEKKSALALDLLMGTRGYRRFDWQPIFNPPLPSSMATGAAERFGGIGAALGGRKRGARKQRMMEGFKGLKGFEELPEGGEKPKFNKEAALAARPRRAPQAAPVLPAPPADGLLQNEAAAAPPEAKVRQLRAKQAPRARAKNKREIGRMMDEKKDRGPAREVMRRRMAEGLAEAPLAEDEEARDWGGKAAARVAGYVKARVFPAPTYSGDFEGRRTDFRETLHWAPIVRTGKDGKAAVTFYTSDAVSSFRISAEGVAAGAAGHAERVIQTKLPFSLNLKLPTEVSAGDKLLLPLSLSNERPEDATISLGLHFGEGLSLREALGSGKVTVAAGERNSRFLPVDVSAQSGKVSVQVEAKAAGLSDSIERMVTVVPRGFPQSVSHSGALLKSERFTIELADLLPGTIEGQLKVYPSPVASMTAGLEGMLREPTGCFEQASSSNYPNVMILSYLQEAGGADPALVARVQALLTKGYGKIAGYETPKKGYEWFGGAPGHEALTAYGLLEFQDMKKVFGGVDDKMVARTAAWLRSRRDGKGGFKRNPRALDSFGGASPEVTNAYIIYSLTASGARDLEPELAAMAKLAKSTDDPYLLALATASLQTAPGRKGAARSAATRLTSMQNAEGVWTGAKGSITRSSGKNLNIETTSLALLALIEDGRHPAALRSGIAWLNANRGGFGQWGATQATVLALKATTRYAQAMRRMPSSGNLELRVNGKLAGELGYEAGESDPLIFKGFASMLKVGSNVIELVHRSSGKRALPYSLNVSYRTDTPDSAEDLPLSLETSLAKQELKMGEPVRLTAHVANQSDHGLPMTLVRIGIPAGLAPQTWQLKELKEKKLVDFYETRPREVILYLRQMAPKQTLTLPLDLVAVIPGETQGPASSTYLYYGNDKRRWVAGLPVKVMP